MGALETNIMLLVNCLHYFFNSGSKFDRIPITANSQIVHHQNWDMDTMLSTFNDRLDAFIKFIEEKWSWKVFYEDNG